MRGLFLLSPFILISLFLFGILVPVFLGIYVYKDADKRGLNPLFWVLVVVLVPGLIGFIIYLIFRGSSPSRRKCPNCNEAIEGNYDVCPNCLYPLENNNNYEEDRRKNNKTLIIFIIIALLVPVLIVLGIVIFGFTQTRTEYDVLYNLISYMI